MRGAYNKFRSVPFLCQSNLNMENKVSLPAPPMSNTSFMAHVVSIAIEATEQKQELEVETETETEDETEESPK